MAGQPPESASAGGQLSDDELRLLGLTRDASARLVHIKLAQLEAESRRLAAGQAARGRLEADIEEARRELARLEQRVQRDLQARPGRLHDCSRHLSELDFYGDKLERQCGARQLLEADRELGRVEAELAARRAELRRLEDWLRPFAGLEPSAEALQARIEAMTKMRLSLDVSFSYPELAECQPQQ